MATINVPPNTTAIDLAFNLSGSLAGFPAVLAQLPVGERIGFARMPSLSKDVLDIGQTWTPSLEGLTLDLTMEIYNQDAVNKAPYTTDLVGIQSAIDIGARFLLSSKFQNVDEKNFKLNGRVYPKAFIARTTTTPNYVEVVSLQTNEVIVNQPFDEIEVDGVVGTSVENVMIALNTTLGLGNFKWDFYGKVFHD